MTVGAIKLKKFLDTPQADGKPIKPSHFARDIGKFPSTIHRILDGQNCPDIQTATLIEEYTKGAVKIADWIEDIPVKRTRHASLTSGSINRK